MHVAGIKQERSRRSSLNTIDARERNSSLDGVAVVLATGRSCRSGDAFGRRRGSEAAELLQHGLHLTFNGCGGSRAVFISYRLQQLDRKSVV